MNMMKAEALRLQGPIVWCLRGAIDPKGDYGKKIVLCQWGLSHILCERDKGWEFLLCKFILELLDMCSITYRKFFLQFSDGNVCLPLDLAHDRHSRWYIAKFEMWTEECYQSPKNLIVGEEQGLESSQ